MQSLFNDLPFPASLAIPVSEISQVGEARRAAISLAASLHFDATQQGKVALVTTEIAANLVHHAGQGEILLRALWSQERAGATFGEKVSGIEILALDSGPGMASVSQCLRDGYSTAGTAGNGLGAIARQSHRFEIYSVVGQGTAALAQVWARPAPFAPTPEPIEYGVVNRPKFGEAECGDAWAVAHVSGRSLFLLADGLGHGPEAANASQTAARAFHAAAAHSPRLIIEALHRALHGTRGAAVACVEVDHARQTLCFAGIGNIAGRLLVPARGLIQSMISYNGIVGHHYSQLQEFVYSWENDSLLVLHSDGLSAPVHLEHYPGLTSQPTGLIAGVCYRDFQRGSDDVTVFVARMPR